MIVPFYQTAGLSYEENGKKQGFCLDLAKAFTQFVEEKYDVDLDLQIVKSSDNWNEFLEVIKNSSGGVFGAGNISVLEERKATYSFTPYFLRNVNVMLTHNSANTLTKLENIKSDFSGYKAYIVSNSTHEDAIKKIKSDYFPSLEVQFYPSGSAILKEIEKDPKVFTIIDFTEFFFARLKRLSIKQQSAYAYRTDDYLGYLMPKNSDWVEVWNEFLTDEYRQSLEYKKMIADNLGTAFTKLIN